jgi:hypothetical protein
MGTSRTERAYLVPRQIKHLELVHVLEDVKGKDRNLDGAVALDTTSQTKLADIGQVSQKIWKNSGREAARVARDGQGLELSALFRKWLYDHVVQVVVVQTAAGDVEGLDDTAFHGQGWAEQVVLGCDWTPSKSNMNSSQDIPKSWISPKGRIFPLIIKRLHFVIPPRSKLRMGARNCRSVTAFLSVASFDESEEVQLLKSICRTVSEQKAKA